MATLAFGDIKDPNALKAQVKRSYARLPHDESVGQKINKFLKDTKIISRTGAALTAAIAAANPEEADNIMRFGGVANGVPEQLGYGHHMVMQPAIMVVKEKKQSGGKKKKSGSKSGPKKTQKGRGKELSI